MMAKKNRLISAVCVMAVLTVSGGCGRSNSPSPAETAKAVAPKPPLQVKISSSRSGVAREQIDFTGKKDPFKPYMIATRVKLSPLPGSARSLPIQQFEVQQFKILGIVTGLSESRALIQDPSGKSYVIKNGSLIGPNNGKVRKIVSTAVEILEQYRDESGRIKNRVVTLTLRRKE